MSDFKWTYAMVFQRRLLLKDEFIWNSVYDGKNLTQKQLTQPRIRLIDHPRSQEHEHWWVAVDRSELGRVYYGTQITSGKTYYVWEGCYNYERVEFQCHGKSVSVMSFTGVGWLIILCYPRYHGYYHIWEGEYFTWPNLCGGIHEVMITIVKNDTGFYNYQQMYIQINVAKISLTLL